MDIQQAITNAIQDGIRDGVKSKLTSQYQNPLDPFIQQALGENGNAIRAIISDALKMALNDEGFVEQLRDQLRHKLAAVLVARFGGELERQVNALKSDPTTRARITLAIEEIVKERSSAV